jgi:hypothetical protein
MYIYIHTTLDFCNSCRRLANTNAEEFKSVFAIYDDDDDVWLSKNYNMWVTKSTLYMRT